MCIAKHFVSNYQTTPLPRIVGCLHVGRLLGRLARYHLLKNAPVLHSQESLKYQKIKAIIIGSGKVAIFFQVERGSEEAGTLSTAHRPLMLNETQNEAA